jgi:hypothetical protein
VNKGQDNQIQTIGKVRTTIALNGYRPPLLRYNTLSQPISLTGHQILLLTYYASDGTWGAFTRSDILEDFAVSHPDDPIEPKIRIYPNNGSGGLDVDGVLTFSLGGEYKAQQIILAQINRSIDFPVSNDKLDLVGIDGSLIKIWRNDNENGLPAGEPYRQIINLGFGVTTNSLAVADINKDGYNDIVVGTNQGAHLFLNTGNENGYISTSAYWSMSDPIRKHMIAIGDIGSPGDPTRTDGWPDLVVASGYGENDVNIRFQVYINRKGIGQPPVYFPPLPDQVFFHDVAMGEDPEGEVQEPCYNNEPLALQLADVKTNGGLSIVYSVKCDDDKLFMVHNHGNPAPAPPQNVQMAIEMGQWGYRHPRVSWNANSERDLAGYELWRKVTGECGNGTWVLLVQNVSASTQAYTDYSIGTAGMGNQCVAQYKLRAKDLAGNLSDYSATVEIDFSNIWFRPALAGGTTEEINKPTTFAFHPAYPNPFNPSTELRFDLPEPGVVMITVFDVLGREVARIAEGTYDHGYHSVTWKSRDLASGVYFARFTVTDQQGAMMFTKVRKLLLAR